MKRSARSRRRAERERPAPIVGIEAAHDRWTSPSVAESSGAPLSHRQRPSFAGSSATHRFSTSGPFDHRAARSATTLNGRRPFDHPVAQAAFEDGAGQARARPSREGEEDLGRGRSSRMEYTAGSGPLTGPYGQFVNTPGAPGSSSPSCPSLSPTVTLAPRRYGEGRERHHGGGRRWPRLASRRSVRPRTRHGTARRGVNSRTGGGRPSGAWPTTCAAE